MRVKIFEWTLVAAALFLFFKVLAREQGSFGEKLSYVLRGIFGDGTILFAREPRHGFAYIAAMSASQRHAIAVF